MLLPLTSAGPGPLSRGQHTDQVDPSGVHLLADTQCLVFLLHVATALSCRPGLLHVGSSLQSVHLDEYDTFLAARQVPCVLLLYDKLLVSCQVSHFGP